MPPRDIDAETARRAISGDEPAFSEVVQFYWKRLYKTAVSILANSADSEEIVQNVFVRFHRYGASYDFSRPLSSYLYRITVLECYRFLEKGKRAFAPSEADLRRAGWKGSDQSAADRMMVDEKILVVREILERLTPRERVCFVMREIEGKGPAEIGESLGISPVTVRRFHGIARSKIAEELRLRFPDLPGLENFRKS